MKDITEYLNDILEIISPVAVAPEENAVKVSLSKRFLLFDVVRKLKRRLEEDPYLNFISLLNYYKVIGKFLHGDIERFYNHRNRSYFRDFFMDEDLYEIVKSDIEWVYKHNQKVKMTITKRGLIVYDNYHQNDFNLLLMTIHSGTWMPQDIQEKQLLSKKDRLLEEDIDTHKVYGMLVLKKGGIWIDNKASRFSIDYNRSREKAIYKEKSEPWIEKIWKIPLSDSQKERLLQGYDEFYFTLTQLVNTYRFNIIFDGHSMKNLPGRADISFGTKHIPRFYMPIVYTMKEKLLRLGYEDVAFNKPFTGGQILKWFQEKFPDLFIFSIEVNKKLYMNKDRTKVVKKKRKKLSKDIATIFDIGPVLSE